MTSNQIDYSPLKGIMPALKVNEENDIEPG